jgi:uncharacterized YccA/Bax inhibitor family protein
MMRSGNPFLKEDSFDTGGFHQTGNCMTLEGVANKTLLLLALCVVVAFASWMTILNNPSLGFILFLVGVIGGFAAVIAMWKMDKRKAVYIAPIYAAFEGLVLGPLSGIMEAFYPGIVVQAVALTFGIFLAMLVIYRMRLIKPTENLAIGLSAAIGAIMMIYMVSFLLAMFSPFQIPYIHGNGLIGIGFSLLVIGVAALTFVFDFDFIENGVDRAAPKHLEWYAAFGLMVTLVWLYIEILRLLSKIRSR